MNVDAAMICQDLAKKNQSLAQKLNEFRTDHFVPVRLLLVFHEVLLCGEWRIYVDEFDALPSAVSIRASLVHVNFLKRHQVVAVDKHVAPSVREGIILVELADKLERRPRRAGDDVLTAPFAFVNQPVLLRGLD